MKVALLKLTRLKTPGFKDFGRGIARRLLVCSLFAAAVFAAPTSSAQDPANNDKDFYTRVRSFSLGGGSATVSGLVLNRDRAQMTFTGTFYFALLLMAT